MLKNSNYMKTLDWGRITPEGYKLETKASICVYKTIFNYLLLSPNLFQLFLCQNIFKKRNTEPVV